MPKVETEVVSHRVELRQDHEEGKVKSCLLRILHD